MSQQACTNSILVIIGLKNGKNFYTAGAAGENHYSADRFRPAAPGIPVSTFSS